MPTNSKTNADPVNHPKHYTSHPSGVECITITRHMGFNLGNAIKYIWRADEKGNTLEDLKKAAWYIADEIKKRESIPCPVVAGLDSIAAGCRCSLPINHEGAHVFYAGT